jgi:uncharacterized protein (TIGR02466 family)
MNIEIKENIMFANVSYTAKLDVVSNKDVLLDISQMRKIDQGILKSNVDGWHSSEYDLKELSNYPSILSLTIKITEIVNTISQSYGIEKKLNLGTLWCNINSIGSSNKIHCHPGSKFSAVYYVQCDSNSGNLVFERPDLQTHYFRCDPVNEVTYESYAYTPFPSMLCIFPAYLMHGVETNKSNIDRISIALNFS